MPRAGSLVDMRGILNQREPISHLLVTWRCSRQKASVISPCSVEWFFPNKTESLGNKRKRSKTYLFGGLSLVLG